VTTQQWPRGLDAPCSIWGTKQNWMTTGNVWFVDSVTGVDAVSPRGLDERRPLASLRQAHTNAVTGDTVVLAATHRESLAAQTYLQMTKRLTVLGSQQSSGIPCPIITLNRTINAALIIGTAEAEETIFSNVQFLSGNNIESTDVGISLAIRTLFHQCYFQVKTGKMISYGGCPGTLQQCTFLSIDDSTPTGQAIVMSGTYGIRMDEVTFDAGENGWYLGRAVDAITLGQQDDLQMRDITLLRGSDIQVYPTSSGCYNVSAASHVQGRVLW